MLLCRDFEYSEYTQCYHTFQTMYLKYSWFIFKNPQNCIHNCDTTTSDIISYISCFYFFLFNITLNWILQRSLIKISLLIYIFLIALHHIIYISLPKVKSLFFGFFFFFLVYIYIFFFLVYFLVFFLFPPLNFNIKIFLANDLVIMSLLLTYLFLQQISCIHCSPQSPILVFWYICNHLVASKADILWYSMVIPMKKLSIF